MERRQPIGATIQNRLGSFIQADRLPGFQIPGYVFQPAGAYGMMQSALNRLDRGETEKCFRSADSLLARSEREQAPGLLVDCILVDQ